MLKQGFGVLLFPFLLGLLATGCGGSGTSSAASTNPLPAIQSFVATPNTVDPGAPVSLSWLVANGPYSVTISGIGQPTGNPVTVNPWVDTTYTLTATNPAGSTQAQVTVSMNPSAPPPALSLYVGGSGLGASIFNVVQGQQVDLIWATTGASQVSLSGYGSVVSTGLQAVTPTATTSYTVTATNGISSSTAQTTIYVLPSAPLLAKDLVYSTLTGDLYASVPPTAAGSPGCVVDLDPATMTVKGTLPVNNPNVLAVSDDGSMLYVGEDDTGSILPINLATWTAGSPFPVWPGQSYQLAGSMCVLPGCPNSLAVARGTTEIPYGITVFDNGVARPTSFPCASTLGTTCLKAGDTANVLYASNGGNLMTLNVDNAGVTFGSAACGLPLRGPFEFAGGRCYCANSLVVEAADYSMVGFLQNDITVPDYLLPDPDANMLYVADNYGCVQLLDLATFRRLGQIQPNSGGGNPTINKIVLAGSKGVALLTGSYLVFLPKPFPTLPNFTASSLQVAQGSPVTITAEAANASALSMVGMTALLQSKYNIGYYPLGPFVSGSGMSVSPMIPNTYEAFAGNGAICVERPLMVAAIPGLAKAALGVPANDIVYCPQSHTLYATVPGWYGNIGNSLVALDPGTGAVQSSLFVGPEPGPIALSDDGTTIYVLLRSGNKTVSRRQGLEGLFSFIPDIGVHPCYAGPRLGWGGACK